MNENARLEAVAGAWITAKTSNVFGSDYARKQAWDDFAVLADSFCRRFGYTKEQFGVKLLKTAQMLYTNELKNEIFGYQRELVNA